MSNGRFTGPRPSTVAIVAMGASSSDYINQAAQHGGRHAIADETWTINAMGGVIHHDRAFAMDDLGELRRDARKGKKVAKGMLDWMPNHPGPLYVIRPYDFIPNAVQYPVEDVLNDVGFPYFNNTVAYAVGYAIYIGVDMLKLYGCDFTYANHHVGESGRGNVEWLLGMAGERGMKIEVSQSTTLLDANVPMEDRLYGFDEPVVAEPNESGNWRLRFIDREDGSEPVEPLSDPDEAQGSGLDKPPRVVEAA